MLSSPVGSSENPKHEYHKQEGSSCDKRRFLYTETVPSETERGKWAYKTNYLEEIQAFSPRAQDNHSGNRKPSDGTCFASFQSWVSTCNLENFGNSSKSHTWSEQDSASWTLSQPAPIGSAPFHFSSILAKSKKRQLGHLLIVSAIKINQQHLSVFGS